MSNKNCFYKNENGTVTCIAYDFIRSCDEKLYSKFRENEALFGEVFKDFEALKSYFYNELLKQLEEDNSSVCEILDDFTCCVDSKENQQISRWIHKYEIFSENLFEIFEIQDEYYFVFFAKEREPKIMKVQIRKDKFKLFIDGIYKYIDKQLTTMLEQDSIKKQD